MCASKAVAHEAASYINPVESLCDQRRLEILRSELPQRAFERVLHIDGNQGRAMPELGASYVGIHASGVAEYGAESSDAFVRRSIFELPRILASKFDLIMIMEALYPKHIGLSLPLVYRTIDQLLSNGGILACLHLDSDYRASFPFLILKTQFHMIDDNVERLEIYVK
jgi:hypothetical protein